MSSPETRTFRPLAVTLIVSLSCTTGAGEPAAAVDPGQPDDRERAILLAIARAALVQAVNGATPPRIDASCRGPYLQQPLGCFVTLTTPAGSLRGCMGMFDPPTPLADNVADRAATAALRDPRFPAVTPAELPGLHVEISVLTRPRPLAFGGGQDLLDRLVPLRDGVILRSPFGSSTFLPQVWEQLPDRRDFLGHLCRKHGAPADCWQRPGLAVQTYRAIVFGEPRGAADLRAGVTVVDGMVRCVAPGAP